MARTLYEENFYASTDGLKLYYRLYPGDNTQTPVLCLPALTRNSRDYHRLATHFSPHRKVVCPDLRGRGQSAWADKWESYEPTVYISDIVELFRILEEQEWIVIGTSLGGILAMILALSQPESVKAVVLNDIGSSIKREGYERIAAYVGEFKPAKSWEEAEKNFKAAVSEVYPTLTSEEWSEFIRNTHRELLNGDIVPNYDPAIKTTFRQALEVVPEGDISLLAIFNGLLPKPAMVIRGETSDLLSRDTVKEMQTLKPDLRTLEIPKRGHAPLLTEEGCIAEIEDFINSAG